MPLTNRDVEIVLELDTSKFKAAIDAFSKAVAVATAQIVNSFAAFPLATFPALVKMASEYEDLKMKALQDSPFVAQEPIAAGQTGWVQAVAPETLYDVDPKTWRQQMLGTYHPVCVQPGADMLTRGVQHRWPNVSIRIEYAPGQDTIAVVAFATNDSEYTAEERLSERDLMAMPRRRAESEMIDAARRAAEALVKTFDAPTQINCLMGVDYGMGDATFVNYVRLTYGVSLVKDHDLGFLIRNSVS